MMQKNISVDKIRNSQKNVLFFCFVLLIMNVIFLFLGGLLDLFSEVKNLKAFGDDLFPTIALQYVPTFLSWIFIIGLVPPIFPSTDRAITALTSSFSIDLLDIQNHEDWNNRKKNRIRLLIHLSFALVFLLLMMIFKWIDDKSAILMIFTLASYSYGSLLGIFAFGILTRY